MNAAAVPEGWHSFDAQGNYCTICGKSTDDIIRERVEFGICLCVPLPTVPEDGSLDHDHTLDPVTRRCIHCGSATTHNIDMVTKMLRYRPCVRKRRDQPNAQGPQETGPLGPYWIYPAARVSERELDLPVLSATTSGVDARVGQRGGDGVTHEGDEPE